MQIVPSGLPRATVDRYMRGMCHALALALHARTQSPLVSIWGIEGGEHLLAHVAVEHPRDPSWIVDVRGLRPLADAIDEYHDMDEPWTEFCTPENVHAWIDDEDRLVWLDPDDMQAAGEIAEYLIDLVSLSCPGEVK